MREYRGKSVLSIEELNDKEIPHKNGWVYGWYVDGWIVGNYAESEDEWIAFEWWSQVMPETVGQFTGLHDKNGVEIYEGDIVRATSRYDSGNMVIVWDRGEFIQVLCENYATYQPGMGHYSIKNFVKEKIGNIYDNPELIAPDPDCQEGVCPL